MSPLASRDTPGGDVSYTQALLDAPPAGVSYTTYDEAIASGALRVRGRRRELHGPEDVAIAGLRSLEIVARRRAGFREPYWFVSTRPGAFDLIHHHIFAVRQVGARLPTVSSAGYPLSVLYQAQDGWSARRARAVERVERRAARTFGVHVPGLWATRPDVMTVWTDHFVAHLEGRDAPPAEVRRCGQGLPDVPTAARERDGKTLGFIGRDFDRKGGALAIEVFRALRATDPELKLVVVTGPDHPVATDDSIIRHGDVPRDRLLAEILPSIDVLLLPTSGDCGAPYGVIEALRASVPVVTTDFPWLSSDLQPPAVHRRRADLGDLTRTVHALLHPEALAVAQAAARQLYASAFTMTPLHRDLVAAYRLAAGREGR